MSWLGLLLFLGLLWIVAITEFLFRGWGFFLYLAMGFTLPTLIINGIITICHILKDKYEN